MHGFFVAASVVPNVLNCTTNFGFVALVLCVHEMVLRDRYCQLWFVYLSICQRSRLKTQTKQQAVKGQKARAVGAINLSPYSRVRRHRSHQPNSNSSRGVEVQGRQEHDSARCNRTKRQSIFLGILVRKVEGPNHETMHSQCHQKKATTKKNLMPRTQVFNTAIILHSSGVY